MRIQLTRDYRKIATSYGLFQNLSGDANIELTESVQNEGIVLRPFQIVTVNRTVWARKLSGAGTGVILTDKLPLNFGADVIPIHVVTLNNRTKFYRDKVDANGNHITCPGEVQGEVGKIYIDLESGSKDHYVYDAASGEFMLLSPEIATEADINAMF